MEKQRLQSDTTETAVVEKPEEAADDGRGHGHGNFGAQSLKG